MIAVVCWKWGALFSSLYVNRLRSMLSRHLHLDHRLYCFTDDGDGIDRDVIVLPLPVEFAGMPRCRRRMKQYDRLVDATLGRRLLSIDLDMVIVDDITPVVDRPEPIVMWKVGYAGVYSGAFVLWNAGTLSGAYSAFAADPEAFPARAQRSGVGSDQAMLNCWLRDSRTVIGQWTEADGFVTWFGRGYAAMESFGMGQNHPDLLPGTRVVVLGSKDKEVMDEGRYPWVREHWR